MTRQMKAAPQIKTERSIGQRGSSWNAAITIMKEIVDW
jgi:hypothetical protein